MAHNEAARKPIAYFTGKGACVTTMYIYEDGRVVVQHRASKIKRGNRSKVTPAEVEAFKRRRSLRPGKGSAK
jgi:hypothetical protein